MPNEKTPMEALIAKLKREAGLIGPNDSTEDKYAKMAFATAIEHAISLLPSERKMVEDAVDAVELVSRRYYKDGTHGDDPMGKEISDTGRHNDGRDYFGLSLTGSQYFDNRFGK